MLADEKNQCVWKILSHTVLMRKVREWKRAVSLDGESITVPLGSGLHI
jgi:hypothetical protein